MIDGSKLAKRIKAKLAEANRLLQDKKHEEALPLFVEVNTILSPPGVAPQIYQCLGALKRWEEMIPTLETMLSVPAIAENEKSATFRYLLGMFYLKYEGNPHKARHVWKDALAFTPTFETRFPAIESFVSSYDAILKSSGDGFSPRVISVDLNTGEFVVSLHAPKDNSNTEVGR